MAMDKDVKAKWLEALRSGKYEQGAGYLEKAGCNCCLGVLARVQGLPAELDKYSQDTVKFEFPDYGKGGGSPSLIAMPPDGFSGLDMDDMNRLAELNDTGHSFEYIADYIERNM